MNTQITFPKGVPLNYDDRGTIRVKGSRVRLDTIVARMQVGDTPEEIHEGFPSLTLAQINTILDWYANNQVEANDYLMEQEAEAERILQELENQPGYMLLREKLQRYREQRLKT